VQVHSTARLSEHPQYPCPPVSLAGQQRPLKYLKVRTLRGQTSAEVRKWPLPPGGLHG